MAVETRPVLPGVYPEYNAERRTTVPPNSGQVVAVLFRHNDGPIGVPELYTSFARWEDDFGTDLTSGRIAVKGAFRGEGLETAGGAGGVLAVRAAGASAAKSAVTLDNPAAADAFEVEYVHEGTRGDDFKIQTLPIVGGVQEVLVLDGTAEVESFSFTIADGLDELETALARSKYVSGSVVLAGVTGLGVGTFPLTGGNDGATLTGAEWLAAADPLQDHDFAYLALDDLAWDAATPAGDASRATISSLIAFRDQQELEGHRFQVLVGGKLDELPADAIDRAEALLSPGVITVGGPGYDDDEFGPLSTAQMAARYAGIRAQRGEGQATHMARLAGGVPRKLPSGARVTLTEVEDMTQAGVVTWARDRWAVAPTYVIKDVNTYAPVVDEPDTQPQDRPRSIWGNPKFVLSMYQFANEAQAVIGREMIGKVVVNDTTRAAAAARVLAMAKDREQIGAFNPGTIVEPVSGSDTDDFITVKVRLTFGRALATLFIKATVR